MARTKIEIKIDALESVYKQGVCFVCKEPCHLEGYAHHACCLAYQNKWELVKAHRLQEEYSKLSFTEFEALQELKQQDKMNSKQ
jgi:hypothetical protein